MQQHYMDSLHSINKLAPETIPALAFALLALGFGAAIALEDRRIGKIRNKLLIAGALAGIALHIVLTVAFSVFWKDLSVRPQYFISVLLNSSIAFAAGYSLWLFKVWSAGDAKLFALFAFLVPLDFYAKSSVPLFPAFNLLINIFMASLLIILFQVAVGFILPTQAKKMDAANRPPMDFGKMVKASRANIAGRWQIFIMMFFLFNLLYTGIAHLQKNAGPSLGLALNISFIFIMLVAIAPMARKLGEILDKHALLKNLLLAVVLGGLLFMIASPETSAHIIRNAKTVAIFMLVIGVARKLLDTYLEKADTRKVKPADIKPGDIPATNIRIESKNGDAPELGTVFVDGLSSKQAGLLRENLSPDAEIEIIKPVAFAPMALAGLTLTLLLRQSIIHYIIAALK